MPRSSGVSFEEGARVVFSDLLQDEGKALAEEIGPSAAFFAGDATSPSDTEALMKFAVEHFGSLDCLVNNAGLAGPNPPIAELPVEKFDQIIAINLRGTFLGIKYALPHMKTGTIINNASVAGFAGGYGPHTYTAAKARSDRIDKIGGSGSRSARDQGKREYRAGESRSQIVFRKAWRQCQNRRLE